VRARSALPARRLVPAVLLLPEMVRLLPGLLPGLVPVQVAEAATIEVLVNLRRSEASEQFLANRVMLEDALPLAVVLVPAHRFEAGRARQQFVRDVMVRHPTAVDLVVSAFSAKPVKESHCRNLADSMTFR
jgi:predicted membrane-bound spermidine synthase